MDVAVGPDDLSKKVECFPSVDGADSGRDGKGEGGGERESKALLAVNGRGETPRRQRSGRRKVQWNDRNGNKLVEVLEFQPSDSSDSDEADYADSCICTVM